MKNIAVITISAWVCAVTGSSEEVDDERQYETPGFEESYIESSQALALRSLFEGTIAQRDLQLIETDAVCAVVDCKHSAPWFLFLEKADYGIIGYIAYGDGHDIKYSYLPKVDGVKEYLNASFEQLESLARSGDEQKNIDIDQMSACELKISCATKGDQNYVTIEGFVGFSEESPLANIIRLATNQRE